MARMLSNDVLRRTPFGGPAMTSAYRHQRAVRILTAIFAFAVLISIAHYTDNYVHFDDFPPAPDGAPVSAAGVLGTWFGLTAAGIAGYLLFRRGPSGLALGLLALYSTSGLVGIAHYLVPGALSMPWWRHAHVSLDIVGGIAMLSFVIWVARARRREPAAAVLS